MPRSLRYWPADGTDPILLTDRPRGMRVLKGATGLGAPPVELVTEDTPLADGTVIRDVYYGPKTVMLPLLLSAPTREQYLAKAANLIGRLNPKSGDGALELAQADGRRFRLGARYVGGMEGAEDRDAGEDGRWWRFGLKLFCQDPNWYDAEPVVRTWENPEPVVFFPIFPLVLSTSAVLGDATLDNEGTAPAWPEWTIDPPATSILLRRKDTGEQISLPYTIPAGRQLLITTRPGFQDIRLDDGTDVWDQLAAGSVFWQIPKGRTEMELALGGSGPGSRVTLSFVRQYLAPW